MGICCGGGAVAGLSIALQAAAAKAEEVAAGSTTGNATADIGKPMPAIGSSSATRSSSCKLTRFDLPAAPVAVAKAVENPLPGAAFASAETSDGPLGRGGSAVVTADNTGVVAFMRRVPSNAHANCAKTHEGTLTRSAGS
jgi:hypothetical protein